MDSLNGIVKQKILLRLCHMAVAIIVNTTSLYCISECIDNNFLLQLHGFNVTRFIFSSSYALCLVGRQIV